VRNSAAPPPAHSAGQAAASWRGGAWKARIPDPSTYQSTKPVSSRRPSALVWKICEPTANTSSARQGSSVASASTSSRMSLLSR
jgi:hypothetical protein